MAAAILSRLIAAGLKLEVDGDTLTASPRTALTPELRETIRDNKSSLVSHLTKPCRRWIITLRSGDVYDSTFNPPATAAEILGWYPGAELTPISEGEK